MIPRFRMNPGLIPQAENGPVHDKSVRNCGRTPPRLFRLRRGIRLQPGRRMLVRRGVVPPADADGCQRLPVPGLPAEVGEGARRGGGEVADVVPAKAGTHNHRLELLRESQQPSRQNNLRRSVWVPAFAGTTVSFPDSDFKQPKAFPRHDLARVLQSRCPSLDERAQGKPGAECTRRSRAPKHAGIPRAGAHGQTTTGEADHTGFPRAMFDGLYVLSPVSGVVCHRRGVGLTTRLTPRSRRQDHTTSPYAADVSSGEQTRLTPQRPSQPAPTFRDDREASP